MRSEAELLAEQDVQRVQLQRTSFVTYMGGEATAVWGGSGAPFVKGACDALRDWLQRSSAVLDDARRAGARAAHAQPGSTAAGAAAARADEQLRAAHLRMVEHTLRWRGADARCRRGGHSAEDEVGMGASMRRMGWAEPGIVGLVVALNDS